MRKIPAFLLLSFLAGCASLPTKEEIAALQYGACPLGYETKIERHFRSGVLGLLASFSGEPIIWPPRKHWYKEPALTGGGLYAGYLVPVTVEQTRPAADAGTKLFGFLFKDNELVKTLGPMQMGSLSIREAVGPLPKDERGWKIGHKTGNDDQSIFEWVLPGETVQNWSELITMQTFFHVPRNMTPEKLATGTAELSRKRCADVSVKILASSATEALYERKTANCAPMRDEYTIGKVIWGPSSITSISYAKTTMMNDTERTKWTDIVGRARLVNECQK